MPEKRTCVTLPVTEMLIIVVVVASYAGLPSAFVGTKKFTPPSVDNAISRVPAELTSVAVNGSGPPAIGCVNDVPASVPDANVVDGWVALALFPG